MSSKLPFVRMSVYVFTITMHLSNIWYMAVSLEKDFKMVPELKAFSKLQPRYFTCWTFFLQIVHAFAGILCDVLVVVNSKNKTYRLPRLLKGFKNTLFSAVLWPSTLVVVTFFWSLYFYDRSLIYPSFVDQVLTSLSNHVMHTAILPIVILEVACRPRAVPRSHRKNIIHLAFHFILYLLVLAYTYVEKGIWIYPIFSLFYGTVYFPLILVSIALLALTSYHIQWPLTRYFHGEIGKVKNT
ncbi:androgen-dependent TFPI-regulating protein-like isoform X2 [Danaus plexippus]|nr:androgen-dependent TFPI-regulating protein-like isoform X2 [Danaus plexippus]XP_032525354.2 androgen-dependent TFPI-regulating protein-like isoform X2 [Danaus plexippus]XP_061381293.1 androgen-dependent TFPI-regulating protein-like isoform X2 [Danaus plexippus]